MQGQGAGPAGKNGLRFAVRGRPVGSIVDSLLRRNPKFGQCALLQKDRFLRVHRSEARPRRQIRALRVGGCRSYRANQAGGAISQGRP